MLFGLYTVAETPTYFNAVYKSDTSIHLVWSFAPNTEIPIGYRYVVYYQYEGNIISHNETNYREFNTYILTGLPIGGVDNISIVILSSHLPSDVVGPVHPGTCIYEDS